MSIAKMSPTTEPTIAKATFVSETGELFVVETLYPSVTGPSVTGSSVVTFVVSVVGWEPAR